MMLTDSLLHPSRGTTHCSANGSQPVLVSTLSNSHIYLMYRARIVFKKNVFILVFQETSKSKCKVFSYPTLKGARIAFEKFNGIRALVDQKASWTKPYQVETDWLKKEIPGLFESLEKL